MFEKNEWWIILAAIGLAVWYYVKKFGKPTASANTFGTMGSIANPLHEVFNLRPAQTTTPVLFSPAQVSSAPYIVRVGAFSTMPGPAQNIPVTRFNYQYPYNRLA